MENYIKDFNPTLEGLTEDELIVLHNLVSEKLGIESMVESKKQACERTNAGRCGTCSTDGTFTPCGI